VDLLGDLNQPLVHVQEGHVAARAAVEPHRRHPDLWWLPLARVRERGLGGEGRSHRGRSRIASSDGTSPRFLIISVTALPFSNRAPVGQTLTHLPQLVQVSESPQGWFKSVMTRASVPRPMTSQVCAPSTSSQTRTQRVQRMQRLWSITKRSCDASTVRG